MFSALTLSMFLVSAPGGVCPPASICTMVYITPSGQCRCREMGPVRSRIPRVRMAKPPRALLEAEARRAPVVAEAPAELAHRPVPGSNYGAHSTTLFPTAVPLEKGQTYYDFLFFGFFSGIQRGVTDDLEIGVKLFVPLGIAAIALPEGLPIFVKDGVYMSAKYRLLRRGCLHLSVRAQGPSPGGEFISTWLFGRVDVTVAAGAFGLLDVEDSYRIIETFGWARSTLRYRVDRRMHVFAEYMHLQQADHSPMELATAAFRRVHGRFSFDVGMGVFTFGSRDSDGAIAYPVGYLNFGYLY